jgi:hypothetical protein
VHLGQRVTVDLLLSLLEPWAGGLAGEAVDREDETLVLLATSLVDRPAALVDAWIAIPDFTCCSVSAVIEVTVDETSWTGHTFDHFWHQNGWFYAVAEVMEKGDGHLSNTFVWDESSLIVWRREDRLLLMDARWEAFQTPFAWRPVSVPLEPFVDALIEAGETFERLRLAVTAECAARGVDDARWPAVLADRGDMPRFGPEEVEPRVAVIAREMANAPLRDLPRLRAGRSRR